MSSQPGQRTGLSDRDRAELRRFSLSTKPRPTHAELARWFRLRFGRPISQSIISRTLSDKFAHLDTLPQSSPSRFRARKRRWPELDAALSLWFREESNRGAQITYSLLSQKAGQLWEADPEHCAADRPSFSVGWVNQFLKRHGVRRDTAKAAPRALAVSHCPQGGSVVRRDWCPHDSLYDPVFPLPSILPDSSVFDSEDISSGKTTKEAFSFPLSCDHLLRLIHQNALRGFLSNKDLLRNVTTLFRSDECRTIIHPSSREICDGLTVIHPRTAEKVPVSLQPTALQKFHAHSSWLNMLPMPAFRDNLIKNDTNIDVWDLCRDLWGDLISYYDSPTPNPLEFPDSNRTCPSDISSNSAWSNAEDDDDDVTRNRRCLIVWGDPWDVFNWEVTPGFIKKWGWTLEGCEDLIQASNFWRASRDEEPLSFSTH